MLQTEGCRKASEAEGRSRLPLDCHANIRHALAKREEQCNALMQRSFCAAAQVDTETKASHFSGKMSRLVLICGPIVSVACGI